MSKKNFAKDCFISSAGNFINRALNKTNLQLLSYNKYVRMCNELNSYRNLIISRKAFKALQEKKYIVDLSFQEKVDYISYQFLHNNGYILNISKPRNFNEKLQSLKLFYRDPLMTICQDKYKSKNYIAQMIGEEYTVPLLGVYDHPDQIDYDKLPEQFALKMNWGCGQNIIVKNRQNMDKDSMFSSMMDWIQPIRNHYYFSFEWAYKNIEPKIIAEAYIGTKEKSIAEYKFFCFMGEVKFMLCVLDRFTNKKVSFYDTSFHKLPFTQKGFEYIDVDLAQPTSWDLMMSLAERLSSPFPLLRVDFLEFEGKVFVGELTFYPTSGFKAFMPFEFDYTIGKYLTLPEMEFFPVFHSK